MLAESVGTSALWLINHPIEFCFDEHHPVPNGFIFGEKAYEQIILMWVSQEMLAAKRTWLLEIPSRDCMGSMGWDIA